MSGNMCNGIALLVVSGFLLVFLGGGKVLFYFHFLIFLLKSGRVLLGVLVAQQNCKGGLIFRYVK